ncbi:hypothetical protein CDAR_533361 [Caerostris darwini]|uniref:Uncharacterized protein n=1 Tax=Caerostris darwini TaxID=1538125 RepID=A0AAV4RS95_9ARAC|nr:hypothetical protein CDAR_533361 [Caerostris darwini]
MVQEMQWKGLGLITEMASKDRNVLGVLNRRQVHCNGMDRNMWSTHLVCVSRTVCNRCTLACFVLQDHPQIGEECTTYFYQLVSHPSYSISRISKTLAVNQANYPTSVIS